MKSLAEALNDIQACIGLEEGAVYFASGKTGDEVKEVEGYLILQTNAGPDVRFGDGVFEVRAVREESNEVFTAECNPETHMWAD